MSDYRCLYPDCGWEGNSEDLKIENHGRHDIGYCPECGNDDIEATDAVGPDDYREQNPLERPSE